MWSTNTLLESTDSLHFTWPKETTAQKGTHTHIHTCGLLTVPASYCLPSGRAEQAFAPEKNYPDGQQGKTPLHRSSSTTSVEMSYTSTQFDKISYNDWENTFKQLSVGNSITYYMSGLNMY